MTCCPPLYAVAESQAATPAQLPPAVGALPALEVVDEGASPAHALTTFPSRKRQRSDKRTGMCVERTWLPVTVGVSRRGTRSPPLRLIDEEQSAIDLEIDRRSPRTSQMYLDGRGGGRDEHSGRTAAKSGVHTLGTTPVSPPCKFRLLSMQGRSTQGIRSLSRRRRRGCSWPRDRSGYSLGV